MSVRGRVKRGGGRGRGMGGGGGAGGGARGGDGGGSLFSASPFEDFFSRSPFSPGGTWVSLLFSVLVAFDAAAWFFLPYLPLLLQLLQYNCFVVKIITV